MDEIKTEMTRLLDITVKMHNLLELYCDKLDYTNEKTCPNFRDRVQLLCNQVFV